MWAERPILVAHQDAAGRRAVFGVVRHGDDAFEVFLQIDDQRSDRAGAIGYWPAGHAPYLALIAVVVDLECRLRVPAGHDQIAPDGAESILIHAAADVRLLAREDDPRIREHGAVADQRNLAGDAIADERVSRLESTGARTRPHCRDLQLVGLPEQTTERRMT